MSQTLIKLLWKAVTAMGVRRVGRLVKRSIPAYKNTAFCFEGKIVEGYVALTIDDGLSRGASETSMLGEVIDLLGEYGAHATFFVCTSYTTREAAGSLIQHGHELGNHLCEDKAGYYSKLSREDFESQLKISNEFLNGIDGGIPSGRWFRAPQGILTDGMRSVIEENGMRHALGDTYCDDWAFSNSLSGVGHVAPLMLRQVHSGGSIAIFHMPERGFREFSINALEAFLIGTKERGLQCTSLSEMAMLQAETI